MKSADRMARRLDQVDRKSQVSVSRAMRARDASRPNPRDIAAALDELEAAGDITPKRGPTAAADRRSPRKR